MSHKILTTIVLATAALTAATTISAEAAETGEVTKTA